MHDSMYPRLTHQQHVRIDKSAQVSESNHPFHDCPVQTHQIMFNNVYTTYIVTNSNDEERAILPGYYMIGEIIAMSTL